MFDTNDDTRLLPAHIHVREVPGPVSNTAAENFGKVLGAGAAAMITRESVRSGTVTTLASKQPEQDKQPVMFYIFNPSMEVWYSREKNTAACGGQDSEMQLRGYEFHEVVNFVNGLQHSFTPIPASNPLVCSTSAACPVPCGGASCGSAACSTITTNCAPNDVDRQLQPLCCATYVPGLCNFVVISDCADVSKLPAVFVREPVLRLYQLIHFNEYVSNNSFHTHGTFAQLMEQVAIHYDRFRVHQPVGELEIMYHQKKKKQSSHGGNFIKNRRDTSANYQYMDGDLFPSSCSSVFAIGENLATDGKKQEGDDSEEDGVYEIRNPPVTILEQEKMGPGDTLYFVAEKSGPGVCSIQENDNRAETLRCKRNSKKNQGKKKKKKTP